MEQAINRVGRLYVRSREGELALYNSFRSHHTEIPAVADVFPTPVVGTLVYKLNGEEKKVMVRIHCVAGDQRSVFSAAPLFKNEVHFYNVVWPHLTSVASVEARLLVAEFCGSEATWSRTNEFTGVCMVLEREPEQPKAEQPKPKQPKPEPQRQQPEAGQPEPEGLRHHFVVRSYKDCLNLPHLRIMAGKIAVYHGLCFSYAAADRHDPPKPPLWRLTTGASPLYTREKCEILKSVLEECLRVFVTNAPSEYTCKEPYKSRLRQLTRMVTKLGDSVADTATGPENCKVICHANYSQVNVIFEYTNFVQVVDARIGNWSSICYGSLGTDLVIWLFVECEPHLSLERRMNLIRVYHNKLEESCSRVPSWDEVNQEIRRCIPIALCTLAARAAHIELPPCMSTDKQIGSLWNRRFIRNVFDFLVKNEFL